MFNLAPDVSRLPVKIKRGYHLMGAAAVAFGGFCLLIAVNGDIGTDLLAWLGLLLGIVLGVPGGLWLMRKSDAIEIDQGNVTQRSRTWTKVETWTEPLANFLGVSRRVDLVSGNQTMRRQFIVELLHAHADKTLLLYESRKEDGIRAFWESAARTFDLPALEAGSEGTVGRQVADLDRSIQDLARDGRLGDDFDPSQAPPKGIAWWRSGGRLLVTVRAALSPGLWVVVGLAGLAAVAGLLGIAMGLLVEEPAMTYTGAVLCLAGTMVGAWFFTARRRIVITPSTLRIVRRWIFGPTPLAWLGRRQVAIGEIESVTRRPSVDHVGREEIRIESDLAGITIGALLGRAGALAGRLHRLRHHRRAARGRRRRGRAGARRAARGRAGVIPLDWESLRPGGTMTGKKRPLEKDRLKDRSDIGEVEFPIEKLMEFRDASASCVHIEAALEADRGLTDTGKKPPK